MIDPDSEEWAETRDAILAGWDPFQWVRETEQGFASFDLVSAAKQRGAAELRMSKIEQILRDPNMRAIAEIANRRNLPHSEVRDRWSEDDIAVELALLAVHAIEAAARCPDCGVSPGEVYDEKTDRALREPAFKISWHECPVCADMADFRKLAKSRSDGSDDDQVGYYRLTPRAPGEPDVVLEEAHIRRSSR